MAQFYRMLKFIRMWKWGVICRSKKNLHSCLINKHECRFFQLYAY